MGVAHRQERHDDILEDISMDQQPQKGEQESSVRMKVIVNVSTTCTHVQNQE
jgi:hypothetical protein